MKLSDLKDEELKKIVEEYYENTSTIKELLEKYKVDYTSNFIQKVCLYSDDECEACGSNLRYVLNSRAYCNSLEENKKVCTICGHNGSDKCNCKVCIENREKEKVEEAKRKRKIIEEAFCYEPISVKELNIKELLFVGILKEGEIEVNIGPLAKKEYLKRLYSYEEESLMFLKSLLKNKVIKININESCLDYFHVDEKESISYYPFLVSYDLNLKESLDDIDIKNELISNFSKDEIEECWYDICLDECIKYLDIRSEAMDLGIVQGNIREEILSLLRELLMEYSIGTICCIIYRAINFASNFKVEYQVNDEKVHKAIYTNIKNYYVKQYNTTKYRRPYELIQTSFNEFFCKRIFNADCNEIFESNVGIERLYKTNEEKSEEEINSLIESYDKLVRQVNELINKGIPKDFIIENLHISEKIYNCAKEISN